MERVEAMMGAVEARPELPAAVPPLADPGAFDAFCRSTFGSLSGAMALYTGDHALGEELAQEALARLWNHRRRFGEADDPSAWCFRVATNLANSTFRRAAVARRARGRVATSDHLDPEPSAERLHVQQALAELPRRQRQAIVLRYYAGLDTRGTAEAMRCAEGTVRALVSQGFDRLRASLGADRIDPTQEVRHG